MFRSGQSSIRLFRIKGIDVYLHWSWFLVALYEIEARKGRYSSVAWNVAEYLALFAIVLTHEFGHALACRSVGGTADTIMLWPLGGVAYVNPPQRPGATLWSIAAGPLVNVGLAPVLWLVAGPRGLAPVSDLHILLSEVFTINLYLLIFNILPIYPLDGGQILRSLLWFPFGRARSLLIASVLGFVGVAGFFYLAWYEQSIWLGLIAAYAGMNCWSGFKTARALRKLEKIPRRTGFACPSCRNAPPIGPFWRCNKCATQFDTFETGGVCPQCAARFDKTTCLDCRQSNPLADWQVGHVAGVGIISSEIPAR